MLHAIINGKTTHWRRYVGERNATMGRVCEEDEITSTFLGPQDYMPTESVYRYWKGVFKELEIDDYIPDTNPRSHKLQLWPNNNRVEPDAHLTFTWADGQTLGILIEFKWHAGLSGSKQLIDQWKNYLNEPERQITWHFFIGLNKYEGAEAKGNAPKNTWMISTQDRLQILNWLKICEISSKLQINNSNDICLCNWIESTVSFLHKIGVRVFEGFSSAKPSLPITSPQVTWRFKGVSL